MTRDDVICELTKYDRIVEIDKFNPYHDRRGRFATANGATSFTYKPGRGIMYDRAIERERARTEASAAQVKFTPAKTVKEATAYAHDVLGIQNVRFGRLNISVVNQINEGLTEYAKKYPDVIKKMNFVGSCQERNKLRAEHRKKVEYENALKTFKSMKSILDPEAKAREYVEMRERAGMYKVKRVTNRTADSAFSDMWEKVGGQGIAINEKYGKNPKAAEEMFKHAVQTKWNPDGCDSWKSVIDHELGHQLDGLTGARTNAQIQKLYNDIDRRGGVSAMGDAVSRYAHASSGKSGKYVEFIAESWSEYKNNPNCRDTAKQVGQIIEQLYNGR